MSTGNYEQIKSILLDLWNKAKARDISSFLYSKDKATNTKTLKAKRVDGSLGDVDIDISDLASQTLNNTFDGENIFKDIYIKDTVLTYVNNENATFFMGGENQYSAVKELVISANTYVSSIVIALKDDLAIGAEVTGINIGTISTDNVVLEHLIVRGTGRVEENSYSVLSSNKVVVVPINRSFSQDIYFMIGAKGMLWNEARYAGVTAAGGENGMPNVGTRLSPNSTNYVGRFLMIGQGLSIKESFEQSISANNAINQATTVGGNDNASKLVKLSSNGKLDPSMLPAEQNGGVRTVNYQSPNQNGNVTVLAEHIKYHANTDITVKGAIDGKVNESDTSNVGGAGQGNKIAKLDNSGKLNDNMMPTTVAKRINGQTVNNNDVTIYSDNINIDSSTSKTIKQALNEGVQTNQNNNFTKKNDFNFYAPTITRDFTIATFNEVGSTSRRYEVFNNNHYVVTVHNKFSETSKRVASLIVPIANAQVGDTVNATYFVINNGNSVIQAPNFQKSYTVEDIDMVGCKCIRIQVDKYFDQTVGFGFAIEPKTVRNGVRIGLAYATDNSYTNSVWSSAQMPSLNQSVAGNNLAHRVFPYKITHHTTSELVTRFELEKVTQMYPRNLIGEMKQLYYDAGNSLEDGTNTWLKANGQAINSNDYPELYEKFNTPRTDDIEVSIPDINSQVGYYYICAK